MAEFCTHRAQNVPASQTMFDPAAADARRL